jgi:hypothetical protein
MDGGKRRRGIEDAYTDSKNSASASLSPVKHKMTSSAHDKSKSTRMMKVRLVGEGRRMDLDEIHDSDDGGEGYGLKESARLGDGTSVLLTRLRELRRERMRIRGRVLALDGSGSGGRGLAASGTGSLGASGAFAMDYKVWSYLK